MNNAWFRIKQLMRRVTKGFLLAIWIFILVCFAALAASGKTSKVLMDFLGFSVPFGHSFPGYYFDDRELSPRQYLRRYLSDTEYAPPIDAVLDVMITNPNWRDRDILSKYPKKDGVPTMDEAARLGQESPQRTWVREQYYDLFSKVENKLRAISLDSSIDPKNALIATDMIPGLFKDPPLSKEVVGLPHEAVTWVREDRKRRDAEKERYALIDTFFLLIVLGAFGSLIFLTKDFLEKEEKTRLAAYIFRPILGMFLALAMFVITVLAHSIVSTADVLQIRHETLYLLAFAGGLLSEQAYAMVSLRAEAALQKIRGKVGVSEQS